MPHSETADSSESKSNEINETNEIKLKKWRADHSDKSIATIEHRHGLIMLGLFSGIFAFFENEKFQHFFEHSAWSKIFFPAAAVLEFFEFGIAAAEYRRSKNKNFGKIANLLAKFQKFALITIAVSLGLAGVAAGKMAVPFIFTGAIFMHALYNAGIAVRSWYRAAKSPPGSAVRDTNLQRAEIATIRTVVGLLLTAAIVILMVLPLFTPIGAAVHAGAAIGAMVVAAAAFTYAVKSAKAEQTEPAPKIVVPKDAIWIDQADIDAAVSRLNSTAAAVTSAPVKSAPSAQVEDPQKAPAAAGDKNDYYYRKGRMVHVTGDDASRLYLINEIKEKFNSTTSQWNRASLWEFPKHRAKSNALTHLELYLSNKHVSSITTEINESKDLKAYYANKFGPRLFQSFWKDVGDVEDIFDAADAYRSRCAATAPAA